MIVAGRSCTSVTPAPPGSRPTRLHARQVNQATLHPKTASGTYDWTPDRVGRAQHSFELRCQDLVFVIVFELR